jgi:hypothetical protein
MTNQITKRKSVQMIRNPERRVQKTLVTPARCYACKNQSFKYSAFKLTCACFIHTLYATDNTSGCGTGQSSYAVHAQQNYTLIENLQREGLKPIEEAEALSRVTEERGYTHTGVRQGKIHHFRDY